MKNVNTVGYIIGKEELIFLISLIGCKQFIGLEDCFEIDNLTDNELRQKWSSVKKSLEDKRFIISDTQRNIVLDKIISFIIRGCCTPKILISLFDFTDGERQHIKNGYINDISAIELTHSNTDSNIYNITPHRTLLSLFSSFRDTIEDKIEDKIIDESDKKVTINLDKEKFETFSNLITENKISNADKLLQELNIDIKSIEELINTFQNQEIICYFLLTEVQQHDTNSLCSLTVLKGEIDYWMMLEFKEGKVVIEKVVYGSIDEFYKKMISKCEDIYESVKGSDDFD